MTRRLRVHLNHKTIALLSACASIITLASASSALARTVTLQYVTWAVQEEIDALKKSIVPRFEATNPGIKVKVVHVPFGDYLTKLLNQMAAGVAPDLITMEVGFASSLLTRNLLTDLTPYAKRDKFKFDVFVDAISDKINWDGKFVGAPMHLVCNAMYYNSDLLSHSGVSVPSKSWNWDDFLALTKKLTKDTNGDGKPDIWGYSIGNWEAQYGPFLWSAGGSILNKQLFGDKAVCDSPEAIEAFSFIQGLLYRNVVASKYTGDSVPFVQGKVGLINEGSWMIPTYRAAKNLNFDITTMPMHPKTGRAATRISAAYISVWSGCRNKNEAWKFVNFMLSDYCQKRKHDSALFAPLTKEQVNWPEFYPETLEPKSARAVFQDLLKVGFTDTAYPNDRLRPVESKYIPAIYNNALAPQVALKEMAKEMNRVFSTLPKRK